MMLEDNYRDMKFKMIGDVYVADGERTFLHERTGMSLTIPDKYPSNGANVVKDVCPLGFFFHDYGCNTGKWDNGSKMYNLQLSFLYHDILKAKGFPIRAKVRFVGTLFGGGGKAKENGIFKLRKS